MMTDRRGGGKAAAAAITALFSIASVGLASAADPPATEAVSSFADARQVIAASLTAFENDLKSQGRQTARNDDIAQFIEAGVQNSFPIATYGTYFNVFVGDTADYDMSIQINADVPVACSSAQPPNDCFDTGGAFKEFATFLGIAKVYVLAWTKPAWVVPSFQAAVRTAITPCVSSPDVVNALADARRPYAREFAYCLARKLDAQQSAYRLVVVMPVPKAKAFNSQYLDGYLFVEHLPPRQYQTLPEPAWTPETLIGLLP